MPHSCLTRLKQTEKHHSLLLQALPKPLNLHMSPRDSKRLKLPRLQYKNIKMQLYAILLASEFQTLRNAKLVLHKACVIQNAQFCTKTFAVDSLSHATYSFCTMHCTVESLPACRLRNESRSGPNTLIIIISLKNALFYRFFMHRPRLFRKVKCNSNRTESY